MANIIETATTAGNFTTLLTAVAAAGLTETLNGAGPFTVFAPTDEAFKKVDGEVLKGFLDHPSRLKKLLTYHALDGIYTSVDLEGESTITTLNGEDVQLHHDDGKTKIDGAYVVSADILVDNGVIHAIDAILVPSSLSGVAEGKNTH